VEAVGTARFRRPQVGAYAVHGEFAPVRVQGTRERLKVGISYLIGLDSFVSRGLSLSTRS